MRWFARCGAFLHRVFPNRQIILRERDRVRCLELPSNLQITAAGMVGIGAVWALIATFGFWQGRSDAHDAMQSADRARGAYRDLLGELNRQESSLAALGRDLHAYRQVASSLADSSPTGDDQTAAPTALKIKFAALGQELAGLDQRQGVLRSIIATGSNAAVSADGDTVHAILDRQLSEQAAALEKMREQASTLDRTIAERTKEAEQARGAAQTAQAEASRLSRQVVDQQQALSKLTAETRSSIQEVERIVAATGLNANRLVPLPPGEKPGRGGPFIPWRGQVPETNTRMVTGTVSLNYNLQRLNQLRDLLRVLPLSAPLPRFALGSPFGYRADPFDGEPAFHSGVDLMAERGSPVHVTAPGVVVSAGWAGNYGRMVEIDHRNGIHTRYAHLDRILVTEGQTVAAGHVVGLLGSTGRSSGPHLHYEVLVDTRPQNPINFLRATAHVLEER